MKIASWVLIASLIFPLQIAVAGAQQSDATTDQQQGDSLAAAARKAQQQKKSESKSAKVWDNDHMPTGTINVVGQTPAPDTDQGANAAATVTVPPTGGAADQSKSAPLTSANAATLSKEQRAALQATLESAKQQVESLKTDLDISQRKYDLDRQSYYGKPDYAADKAGSAALDDEKMQLEAKLQELSDAQKHVDDLQAQIASAGPPNDQGTK